MNDFTAIVKLSLFLVKKEGGGEVQVSHLRVVYGKEHIKTWNMKQNLFKKANENDWLLL